MMPPGQASPDPAPAPLRLAAVVPHTILRRGLEAVFDGTPGVDLVHMGIDATDLDGFASDAFDAVVVLVTGQAGDDSIGVLAGNGHRVLALGSTAHRDDALEAGAMEFVDSDAEPDLLLLALERVARGDGATAAAQPRVNLAVLVNHPVGRAGLAAIFTDVPGYDVTFMGVSAAEVPPGTRVDVVLLGLGPSAPLERLAGALELGAPVLCFGLTQDRDAALAAGAHGYMRGAAHPAEIFAGVDALAAGERYVPMEHASLHAVLSPRERDVLAALATGCTDREIGDRLGISMRTVQSHLDRIRAKTGRRRRAELTRLAMELGLTSTPG